MSHAEEVGRFEEEIPWQFALHTEAHRFRVRSLVVLIDGQLVLISDQTLKGKQRSRRIEIGSDRNRRGLRRIQRRQTARGKSWIRGQAVLIHRTDALAEHERRLIVEEVDGIEKRVVENDSDRKSTRL